MESFNIQEPINPQLESLYERVHPAMVWVDNNACENYTVLKVNMANMHGILLEMVQIMTDFRLVISKSFICSDGEWLMNEFHVTDQSGNKITDNGTIFCIDHDPAVDANPLTNSIELGPLQNFQALRSTRGKLKESQERCSGRNVGTSQVSTKGTALEITTADKPGLLSEVSAVLAGLGCHVTRAVAWTHNARAACIIYVEENVQSGPITDMAHLASIEVRLQVVVKARHEILPEEIPHMTRTQREERWSVRWITPAAGELHAERRLHQLMVGDLNYEMCSSCGGSIGGKLYEFKYTSHDKNLLSTLVSIYNWERKGYSVVSVRSRDRPKLLFDTICALTDMEYVVYHAAIRCNFSMAFQEYYIRHKDGSILDTEEKRHKLVCWLVAAVDRRDSQGLRVDVSASNRRGLLSDVTRVLRECGVSVLKAEVSIKGEKATGTFYVRGTSGEESCEEIVKTLMKSDTTMEVLITPSIDNAPVTCELITSASTSSSSSKGTEIPKFSIGGLIWSRLKSLASSFVPIKFVGFYQGLHI